MRGEHSPVSTVTLFAEGSSPHARGARFRRRHVRHDLGIIPACAGSTSCGRGRRPPGRDHPRMRGEHLKKVSKDMRNMGSSPHARGALSWTEVADALAGIIPACAGSTASRRPSGGSCWDHPRMRGEHPQLVSASPGKSGSSPHARGAHLGQGRGLLDVGIIPACAGSTMTRIRARPRRRDHPRMRGEHSGSL